MKKFAVMLAVMGMAASMGGMTAYAENLDKDYIVSEIWADVWNGKPDDGTTFPESSYKYHLLSEWVEDNYGDDDYNWSDVGELTYDYKDYYRDYIEDFDFNDDESGNWTIDTEDEHYSFYMLNGMWQMIDQNGDTVDTFPPHNTLEDSEGKPAQAEVEDKGGQTGAIKVSGGTESNSKGDTNKGIESDTKSAETAQTASQNASEGNTSPLVLGVAALVSVAVILAGVFLFKNRK